MTDQPTTADDMPYHLRHLYVLAIKARLAHGAMVAAHPAHPQHIQMTANAAMLVDPLRAGLEEALSIAFAAHRDTHPLRYATTTPDGQVVTGLVSDAGDQTWRDYTIEGVDEHPITACRSEETCEGFVSNKPGQYLTLGEAVDWAKEHAAAHDHDRDIEERAAREDDLRAGLGSAYYNLPYPIADTPPWNGQPMTATVHPADGTLSPELSSGPVGLTAHDSGTYDETLLPRGPVTVWRDDYPHRPQPMTAHQEPVPLAEPATSTPRWPADGAPAELSGKQDGAAS